MFVSYSVTAVLKFVVAHDQKFFSSDFLYFSRWATAWLFFFKTRCSRLLSHHNLVTAPVLVLVALINVRRSSSTHCIFSDPVKEHIPPFWLIRNEFPELVAQSKQSRRNFWDCARWGLMARCPTNEKHTVPKMWGKSLPVWLNKFSFFTKQMTQKSSSYLVEGTE